MMIVPVFCGECIKESILANSMFVDEHMIPVAEIKDDPIYDVQCSKGHKSKCLVVNEKFELLFDLGFNALIDGYYRESVSSFASALERFYEFGIRIFLKDEIELEKFESAMKIISNQSERQIGAFCFLYLSKIKNVPKILSTNDVTFRNKVIHKGYIPLKEEALQFGESVRSVVNDSIQSIRKAYGEKLIALYESPFNVIAEREKIEYSCTLTPILDCRYGPVFEAEDVRNKSLLDMVDSILNRRKPQRIRFFKDKEALESAKKSLK